MLESKCNECEGKILGEDIVFSSNIYLSSITINKGETLLSVIKKLDNQITLLKNNPIQVLYENIETEGCITKSLESVNNISKIKLSLDNDCVIENSTCGGCEELQVIITASRYNICDLQTSTLTVSSGCTNNIVWYNQTNSEIGTGTSVIVNNAGSFYAKCGNKVSNVITITKQLNCNNYVYTKVKQFVKECDTDYTGTAVVYTKNYTSVISYNNALELAIQDEINFNTEGQNLANSTGSCIYNPPVVPTGNSCFQVYLTNAQCTNLPVPTN